MGRSYFHLHLVSNSTGETLIAASRAASAQYQGVASIEHVYPLVRTPGSARPLSSRKSRTRLALSFSHLSILIYHGASRKLREPQDRHASPSLGPILTLLSPISVKTRRRGLARSTCSTPIISSGSTRLTLA